MRTTTTYSFDYPIHGLSETQSQVLAGSSNWVASAAELLAAKDDWASLIEHAGIEYPEDEDSESVGIIVGRVPDLAQRYELMSAYNRFIDAHIEYCRPLAENLPKYKRPIFSILFWPVVVGLIVWAIANVVAAAIIAVAVLVLDLAVYNRRQRAKHHIQAADFDGDIERWRATLEMWGDRKFRAASMQS